jgi:hypothetical protein
MSHTHTIDEARGELRELKQEIQARRRALIDHGLLDDHVEQEWKGAVRQYRTARQRLAGDGGAQARLTANAEMAALRNIARRWASRVDGDTGSRS